METATHGQVLARFGHALSDATRARLLLALREAPGYPSELAALLGVTRQNLSNHLACLRGCGLVHYRTEGRQSFYALTRPELMDLLQAAEGVLAAVGATEAPRPASGTVPRVAVA
jgi:DNA-binding transcriptional ArsR family regulator